jgi:hypothetical protein
LRAIRTLNLSLLVNPAKAEVFFNDRQFIPEREAQPFTDEQALLAPVHYPLSLAAQSPLWSKPVMVTTL